MLLQKIWVLVFSIRIWYLAYPTDRLQSTKISNFDMKFIFGKKNNRSPEQKRPRGIEAVRPIPCHSVCDHHSTRNGKKGCPQPCLQKKAPRFDQNRTFKAKLGRLGQLLPKPWWHNAIENVHESMKTKFKPKREPPMPQAGPLRPRRKRKQRPQRPPSPKTTTTTSTTTTLPTTKTTTTTTTTSTTQCQFFQNFQSYIFCHTST